VCCSRYRTLLFFFVLAKNPPISSPPLHSYSPTPPTRKTTRHIKSFWNLIKHIRLHEPGEAIYPGDSALACSEALYEYICSAIGSHARLDEWQRFASTKKTSKARSICSRSVLSGDDSRRVEKLVSEVPIC